MADINEPLRYSNGVFDIVHARFISMAVRVYPSGEYSAAPTKTGVLSL